MTREEIARAYEYKIPPKFLSEGGGSGSDEVWYPHISAQGVISWTKENTSSAPTPTNIKGADGQNGTNGRGITSVTKFTTVGLVDIYQILFTDDTTSTFTVTNGEEGPRGETGAKGDTGTSITSIVKTGTNGLVDTYTVYFSNGTTTTFSVTNGANGKSAYEVAVDNGYEGSEESWLASLHGADGESAYQVAVDNGFVGTEAEWLASLVGPQGETGATPAIEMSASVDDTTGTPSVVVSKIGTAEAPLFDFAFSGLKGEPGKSAGLVQLSDLPVAGYNPSVDNDTKMQFEIPFDVDMTDDTVESGYFVGYGMLPAFGTGSDNGMIRAYAYTNVPIQVVPCMIEPSNDYTWANLPDACKENQVAYLYFMMDASTQRWELFRVCINEGLDEVITQTGDGNIWYDQRAAFATVSRQNIQNNTPTAYASGGVCQIILTVPDYRDQSISRTVSFLYTIPALPTPLTNGPHGEIEFMLETFTGWPAYGDDDGVYLRFKGKLTLTEEIDSQTHQATGKYIIKEFTVNYFNVSDATASIFA